MDYPERVMILDIDGLRRDVWLAALQAGELPHLGRLMRGPAVAHLDPVSTAPAITFNCQTSLFTGAWPRQHGIVGNQFFDRGGLRSGGRPRFYAFDLGETLEVADAVGVFAGRTGLLNDTVAPEVPTLYERAAAQGRSATVAHHMLSRGAATWLRPSVVAMARATKGGPLALPEGRLDADMVEAVLAHWRAGARPDLLTAYFLGLDHASHAHGPGAQRAYLRDFIDPQVGRLLQGLEAQAGLAGTLVVVLSDHGQIDVPATDQHSLRLGFPFDRELASLFDALHLDVHDRPGEAPNCDAVVACNGGTAFVYRQRAGGRWADPPRFEAEVLPLAQAFWDAHQTGRHAPDLRGALELVLARNVEAEGGAAEYQVVTPAGTCHPLAAYLADHPALPLVDAGPRVAGLAGPNAGDLLLVARLEAGYYFGQPIEGVHGGLSADDSEAVLSLAWQGAAAERGAGWGRQVSDAVAAERAAEGGRRTSVKDLVPALAAGWGWV